jgi:acyl-coenzyme A synthetase/AMP-(fatty) acid ligase
VRSPLLGQVVAADVVVRGDAVPRLLIPELKRFTADHLEAHERPRRISVVADLAVAASGKVQL